MNFVTSPGRACKLELNLWFFLIHGKKAAAIIISIKIWSSRLNLRKTERAGLRNAESCNKGIKNAYTRGLPNSAKKKVRIISFGRCHYYHHHPRSVAVAPCSKSRESSSKSVKKAPRLSPRPFPESPHPAGAGACSHVSPEVGQKEESSDFLDRLSCLTPRRCLQRLYIGRGESRPRGERWVPRLLRADCCSFFISLFLSLFTPKQDHFLSRIILGWLY